MLFILPGSVLAEVEISIDGISLDDENEEKKSGQESNTIESDGLDLQLEETSEVKKPDQSEKQPLDEKTPVVKPLPKEELLQPLVVKTFEDRIRSVQKKVFLKRERYELQPFYAVSLGDSFLITNYAGGSIIYHWMDGLAMELRLGLNFLSLHTDDYDSIRAETRFEKNVYVEDKQNPGNCVKNALGECEVTTLKVGPINPLMSKPRYMGSLNLQWTPLYGKVSLFAVKVFHFDIYLSGGLGAVYTHKYGGQRYDDERDNDEGRETGVSVLMNAGLGWRLFLTRWLTVRAELNEMFYREEFTDVKTRGVVEGKGQTVTQLKNNLLFYIGAGFYFPMSFSYDQK